MSSSNAKRLLQFTSAVVAAILFAALASAQEKAATSDSTPKSATQQSRPAPSVVESTQQPPASQPPAPRDPAEDRLPFMAEERQASSSEAPSTFGLVAKTLGSLLLIIGLIVGSTFALRKLGGARFGAARDDAPELSVISSVNLGDKRSLSVVRFGDRTLLVGSTASSITLLVSEEPHASINPRPRSVADILNSEDDLSFEDEITRAARSFDDPNEEFATSGGMA